MPCDNIILSVVLVSFAAAPRQLPTHAPCHTPLCFASLRSVHGMLHLSFCPLHNAQRLAPPCSTSLHSLLLTHAPCSTSLHHSLSTPHTPRVSLYPGPLRSAAAHLSLAPRLTPPCYAVPSVCFSHMPRASLHSASLCSAVRLTHAQCLISLSLPALLCASHMHYASLHPAPFCSFCRSHMHHASLHPAPLCSPLHHTLHPCLISLSLPALRSASHTAPCSMSPCLPVPALLLTHAPCSASPWSAVPLCFSRMPHALLHPACLFSTLLFSSGACSALPFLPVLHMPHASLHPACLCPPSASHNAHPCLISLSLPALRSASHTAPCSMSPCLPLPALLLTHAPCLASPWSAAL